MTQLSLCKAQDVEDDMSEIPCDSCNNEADCIPRVSRQAEILQGLCRDGAEPKREEGAIWCACTECTERREQLKQHQQALKGGGK